MENEVFLSSFGDLGEEKLGVWTLRLRFRVKSVSFKYLKGRGNRRRGKRKFFEGIEDDDVDIDFEKDELEDKVVCLEGEIFIRLGGVRDLIDYEDELYEDYLGDEGDCIILIRTEFDVLINDVDVLINEDDGDYIILIRAEFEGNEEIMDGGVVFLVDEGSEVFIDILVEDVEN